MADLNKEAIPEPGIAVGTGDPETTRRAEIMAKFPALEEGEEHPPDLLPQADGKNANKGGTAATSEKPAATSETSAASSETPVDVTNLETSPQTPQAAQTPVAGAPAPAETPDITQLRQQAQIGEAFVARVQQLPSEQRQAVFEAMGLVEPRVHSPLPSEYEPQSDFEGALMPHLGTLLDSPRQVQALSQQYRDMDAQLQEVFSVQSQVLDQTAVQSEIALACMEVFAEALQLQMPQIDAAKVLEAVRGGRNMREFVREAMKDVKAANIERVKQSQKERPSTLGESANGFPSIDKTDDMSTIFNKMKGLRSA